MITIEIDEAHYDYLLELLRIARDELAARGMRMEAERARETLMICVAAESTRTPEAG